MEKYNNLMALTYVCINDVAFMVTGIMKKIEDGSYDQEALNHDLLGIIRFTIKSYSLLKTLDANNILENIEKDGNTDKYRL